MTVQFSFTLAANSLPGHLLSEPTHCWSLQTLVEADKVPLPVMQWVMQLFPKINLDKNILKITQIHMYMFSPGIHVLQFVSNFCFNVKLTFLLLL